VVLIWVGKGDNECKDRAAVRGKKGETPLAGAGAAEEEEKRDESKGGREKKGEESKGGENPKWNG